MVILAQLQRLFTPRPDKNLAQQLYVAVVEQARKPVFYTALGVPDTLDGRFELIVLHMHLVLQRLQASFSKAPERRELSRLLIEYYFSDMDRSLREMGVGDSGIKYRVQKMTSAFYGRLEAYGMAEENPAQWPEALRRNIYGTSDAPEERWVHAFMAYIPHVQQKLAALDEHFGAAELRAAWDTLPETVD